jgi:hypothetical protein
MEALGDSPAKQRQLWDAALDAYRSESRGEPARGNKNDPLGRDAERIAGLQNHIVRAPVLRDPYRSVVDMKRCVVSLLNADNLATFYEEVTAQRYAVGPRGLETHTPLKADVSVALKRLFCAPGMS